MKKYFIYFLHKLIAISAKITANIYSPGARKKIMFEDILEMKKHLQPGDVILTRTDGELTTFIIPGFWKHAAIYTGGDYIIDATRAGVHQRFLADLTMRTDHITILRVKDVTKEQQDLIVECSKTYIGKEYDFEMTIENTDKVYCSELVYNAINHAFNKDKLKMEETAEIEIYSPQNTYEDSNFCIIFEIKDR